MATRTVTSGEPGIARSRRGRGFVYRSPDGTRITDDIDLSRIRELAIPPAWRQVWICADEDGHIQATGVDAADRTQYRYHEDWTRAAAEQKFDRMIELAATLPSARRTVTRDLRAADDGREHVLAAAFRLLDSAYLRIGSERYAREHGSVGLITLRASHVEVSGRSITLRFRGKSGVPWESRLSDPDLARTLRRLQDGGSRRRLLAWEDGRRRRSVRASDINDDLRARTGGDYTAKDFRTIHARRPQRHASRASDPRTPRKPVMKRCGRPRRRSGTPSRSPAAATSTRACSRHTRAAVPSRWVAGASRLRRPHC
ncbi:DNA topoisomerase IB [Microbacterium gorillae]|uniref:DNA topoisomerase IB n=1 Tax=Microbacterium gorillae TaxID=1231063 RepID=UPI0006945327|nr:DNA topoisomerase IB [Microbacterium gorillae]